jgi:hypothetical protein
MTNNVAYYDTGTCSIKHFTSETLKVWLYARMVATNICRQGWSLPEFNPLQDSTIKVSSQPRPKILD